MWLGSKHGHLTDWTTQQWVRLTGRRIDLQQYPWLSGPVGKTKGIGLDFFQQLAVEQGLTTEQGEGLLDDFTELVGEKCQPATVSPAVKDFYEHTRLYEIEAWSEWCGWFRPFGWMLANLFSRRLQQLNVPLSALDTSRGMTSNVINLIDPETGAIRYTAWVRQLLSNRNVLYAGSYSVCTLPGFSEACVKVVFPLPNGNAIIIMYPEGHADGSFSITSAGERFGEPGFYFTVCRNDGVWARYVRAMRESIRVYPSGSSDVRADHTLKLWGAIFLRLHYKLRRTVTAQHVQAPVGA